MKLTNLYHVFMDTTENISSIASAIEDIIKNHQNAIEKEIKNDILNGHDYIRSSLDIVSNMISESNTFDEKEKHYLLLHIFNTTNLFSTLICAIDKSRLCHLFLHQQHYEMAIIHRRIICIRESVRCIEEVNITDHLLMDEIRWTNEIEEHSAKIIPDICNENRIYENNFTGHLAMEVLEWAREYLKTKKNEQCSQSYEDILSTIMNRKWAAKKIISDVKTVRQLIDNLIDTMKLFMHCSSCSLKTT
jgi:hypothetical protein